jgi:hypothetical protein
MVGRPRADMKLGEKFAYALTSGSRRSTERANNYRGFARFGPLAQRYVPHHADIAHG